MNADAVAVGPSEVGGPRSQPEVRSPNPSLRSESGTRGPSPASEVRGPGRGSEEPRFGSFAAALLRTETPGWLDEAHRLGVGLGLAALFGGALGLRAGGASIASHALGVAAGLLAVAAVAAPSFAIVLALVKAPVDGQTLARATSRAVARAGLLLGGLAPAAALYVLTVEDAITVSIVGFGGLLLAGAIAASSFAKDLREPLADATIETRRWMTVAMPAFIVFAAALATRVWWLALPILTKGAQ